MNRTFQKTVLLFHLLLFWVTGGTFAREMKVQKPNIILIIVDDLGYGEAGCYGGDIATPHIDSLAQEGVRFTNAYVTAPFCAASRAGLITGKYQNRFGFENNPIGPQNSKAGIGLPVDQRTIADRLRHHGYVTGFIGKWHLGATAPYHPQRRGFDEFVGFLHEGHYYVPPPWAGHVTWLRRKTLPDGTSGRWTRPDGQVIWSTHMNGFEPDYDADNPILRNSQPIDIPQNLTDFWTSSAEDFISRNYQQPFFLVLSYNAVHSPIQASHEYLDQFRHIPDIHRRLFAAMLAQLDDGIGRIATKIDDLNVRNQTVVIFISDNGGPTRELTSSNRPLRGEKGQLLEGGIRVPLIFSGHKSLLAGKTVHQPVISLDIAATIEQLATGKTVEPGDGISLWHAVSNDQQGEDQLKNQLDLRNLYWRTGRQAALRQGRWKIYRPRTKLDIESEWELYDLEKDPSESVNLASSSPERLQQLIRQWQQINSQMKDPLW